MSIRSLGIILLGALLANTAGAEWSLSDHLDRVLVYNGMYFREYKYGAQDIQGVGGGRLMCAVLPQKDGSLKPYADGMGVQGQVRAGQLLFAGQSVVIPTIAEFVVIKGSRLNLEYGLCDLALKKGNKGTLLKIEVDAGGQSLKEIVRIEENRWSTKTLSLPGGERALVRMTASRIGGGSTNWTGLVVRGDGELGTRDQARALSPNKDRIGRKEAPLQPSPYRVTARPGYDILFYRDQPFLSYAAKGHGTGSQEYQVRVGVNTYYNEGMSFTPYWPEGAAGVVVPEESAIGVDLRLCRQFDMPFKAAISMAHCCAFLPPWLVAKEKLGLEGHQLRRGGATHTSFIKPATLRFHELGLEGWLKPFRDQPIILVFGQEDDASLWDDYSKEAVASWRAWLQRRFGGDFRAFSEYVGGVRGVSGFDDVPQPKRFEPDEHFGYPMRLAYLKLLWITQSYGDYLAELFAFVRKLAPGVPLTQRYVNWANGPYVSRRVGFDYNYTFGHLSVEGVPNSYGIGKKCWAGIYAHFGTLPFPRGASIGKTYGQKLRRGAMNQAEWELNAYTVLANGGCGFEYSPFFPEWGGEWEQAALYDPAMNLTPTGEAGERVMKEVLRLSPRMMHYEQYPDVAVFHDASFNTSPFAGRWGQSKVGLYTLIRETGFHPAPLTEWDMTPEGLRGRKALVLAGSLSIAPEIQSAIREYVREGGTLVTVFCSDGQGFPGCNGYDYACKPRESASARSFDNPKAIAHLGDVLGIAEGGGLTAREQVCSERYGTIALRDFNALAAEGKWVAQQACCAKLTPRPEATVLATFEDGSPAAIEHRFGKGRAVTLAFDIGLIANNLTVPPLHQWWSDLLSSLGCRKVVDTGNWFVEGGAWHDDAGRRLIILVNHDMQNAQTAQTPDGKSIRLEAGKTKVLE